MLKIENGKPIVYKESKNMGILVFKEVSKDIAKDLCIKYHYAHKWNVYFGLVNIGVFRLENPDKCLGVASFGSLMHPDSYNMISDDIKKDEIIELNRLWVDDCLGKNTESMLLSASWKILKRYNKYKVVQSFADGRLGCGTIYKASSFKYYGYEESRFLKNIDTDEIYFRSLLTDTRNPKKMLELLTLLCDNKLKAFKPRSYRYIFCLDKNVKIKLKELPYPEYNKGFNETELQEVIDREFTTIFRSYIISQLENINMNSKQIISKFLLNNFDEHFINDQLNIQKQNKTLNKLYNSNAIFKDLLKINDWIPLLQKDSKEKQKILEQVNLW